MIGEHPKRRWSDAEGRSITELLGELALEKGDTNQKISHLLSELQVRQAKLEMQNQELREAQQALEETRDRYAALYDFSPVGYLTLDDTGLIVDINLTGAIMLGMERANLLGKSFSMRLANGDAYAFFHHLRQVFHSLGNTVTDLRVMNKGGGMTYVRMESAQVINEQHHCRTVMINITEQQRVAEELQNARIQQEVLLNAIPAYVFYKDINFRYVAVSQMFADFLGRRVSEVVGKTDFDLFPKEKAEEFECTSSQVLAEGVRKTNIESIVTDAAGNTVYLSTVLAPLFNPPGKISGLLGVGLDVTPIKTVANLNRDLMLQNRTLLQNLFTLQENERRHLARELHDELGQWITAISAEAHAIDSMVDKEHKIVASARAINVSASKMHKVIRNMMNQLRPELLDELGLTDSLHELINQWQMHNPDIDCDLLLDGPFEGFSEIAVITVYRIIQEALSNIARHAHASRVLVHLRRAEGKKPDSDFMLLTVEDNGKGFEPESSKGFGVLGMRERAIAACGEFSLCNQADIGVRIDVRLPIECKIERRK